MKNRNPIVIILLSIITFGIYDLYWLVDTKRVLNESTDEHVPTIWMLIAPWFVLLAGYIVLFAAGSHSSTDSNSSGGAALLSLALIGIGYLLVLVLNFIWFFKFSKAVSRYTQGKMSTTVTFLVLYLVHLIGVALIQDAFNDMEKNGAAGFNQQQPMPAGAGPVPPAVPQTFPTQQPIGPTLPPQPGTPPAPGTFAPPQPPVPQPTPPTNPPVPSSDNPTPPASNNPL